MITARSGITGKQTTRNISHYKRIPSDTQFPVIKEEEGDPTDEQTDNHQPIISDDDRHSNRPPIISEDQRSSTVQQPHQRKTYPHRNHRPVSEWKYKY